MSKSVLVIDTPENCISCSISRDCSNILETCTFCPITGKCVLDKEAESIPDWCPLKPLPEKSAIENDMTDYQCGMIDGRNQCIDEIAGEAK
jgi:hypothetical protein